MSPKKKQTKEDDKVDKKEVAKMIAAAIAKDRKALKGKDKDDDDDDDASSKHSSKRGKKKSRHRSASESSKSSSSSSGSDDVDDHIVNMWVPSSWTNEPLAMLQRFEVAEATISRNGGGSPHLKGEVEFVRALVKIAAEKKLSAKKLRRAIGRRVIILVTKGELSGYGKEVEIAMGAGMTTVKKWAKIRARCRGKYGKEGNGRAFRGGRSGAPYQRGRGGFRGGRGAQENRGRAG